MFVLLAGKAGERKTFECPIYALSIYSMLLLLLAQYKHLDSKILATEGNFRSKLKVLNFSNFTLFQLWPNILLKLVIFLLCKNYKV